MDSVSEALKQARYGEAVLVSVASEGSADETRELILSATLDEDQGGIVWKDVSTAFSSPNEDRRESVDEIGIVRHLRTKRWVLPMLNDTRRNELYDRAIDAACHETVRRQKQSSTALHVLDIGSGTGLLGMIAAKHALSVLRPPSSGGSNHTDSPVSPVKVTSLEMAQAMASLARKTIASNQLHKCIDVIEEHSCETTLQTKASLCVSELLESGLLGEGILPALRDAWDRHLHPDAVIVPQRSRVFCQVLEGKECIGCFRGPNATAASPIRLTTAANDDAVLLGGRGDSAPGDGILVPVHAEALFSASPLGDCKECRARALTEPAMILEFDFSKDMIPGREGRCRATSVVPTATGTAHGVLFWWELDLWNDITYSTEPGKEPWQDHWQQCLYVFPDAPENCPELRCGEAIDLSVSHSDYRISFSIHTKTEEYDPPSKRLRQKVDTGILNKLISPERAMQLNCENRISLLQQAVSYALATKGMAAPVLDLSDFSLCAILAATQGAENVSSLESSTGIVPLMSAQVAQLSNGLPQAGAHFQIIQSHAENITVELLSGKPIEVVLAEPYYELLEGWHLQEALNYFFLVRSLRKRCVISSPAVSVPTYATVMGCAIQFDAFASAHKGCGDEKGSSSIRGFCHDVVNKYGDRYHLHDASLPLWQYDFKRLTGSFELARISYEEPCVIEGNGTWKSAPFKTSGTCHAIMIWIEYRLRISHEREGGCARFSTLSTSTRSHRQVVRMLPEPVIVEQGSLGSASLSCKATLGGLAGPEDHSFELRVQV